MRSLRTKKLQTNVKNIILSFILHNFAKNCGSVPTNDILMLQTTILAMRKTYMTATLIAVAAMAGCNTPSRHAANGQETERFRTDTTVSLTQGVSPECRLTLDVEYIGRDGIHPDMEFHHQVATMTLIQAANFIKEQFDIPKTSEEIFNDFQNMVIEEYRNTIPLKPYARELVKWMKRDGYKVAVATANEIHLSEMVLERTGLMADVDTIVSCTMAGASKESPAVYELACANMRITPVECVIFEDSLRAMYTAKKAGFVTVAVYDDVAKDSWEEICRITDEQVVLE